MYVYLCQMSCGVLVYFVVFDLVLIWYLFSLILTLYSMYLFIIYMSPLYINMFQYLFQYFSVLYFFLHMIILCLSSFSKKTVFNLSWITCNVINVYFVFQTMYKFIEINYVLFCSVLLTLIHSQKLLFYQWLILYAVSIVKWSSYVYTII